MMMQTAEQCAVRSIVESLRRIRLNRVDEARFMMSGCKVQSLKISDPIGGPFTIATKGTLNDPEPVIAKLRDKLGQSRKEPGSLAVWTIEITPPKGRPFLVDIRVSNSDIEVVVYRNGDSKLARRIVQFIVLDTVTLK